MFRFMRACVDVRVCCLHFPFPSPPHAYTLTRILPLPFPEGPFPLPFPYGDDFAEALREGDDAFLSCLVYSHKAGFPFFDFAIKSCTLGASDAFSTIACRSSLKFGGKYLTPLAIETREEKREEKRAEGT